MDLVRSGVKVGGRDGELGPVVDVVSVRRPLEQPVQPVLEPVEQLVLENGQIVRLVQNWDLRLSSLAFNIGLRVAAVHLGVVEAHEGPGYKNHASIVTIFQTRRSIWTLSCILRDKLGLHRIVGGSASLT